MTNSRVEYLGFTAREKTREYSLRVIQPDGDYRAFTLVIPNKAFLERRVRYQDAPEICFLRLQRELNACGEDPLPLHLDITDAELDEYRVAHTPKPNKNRPKVPFA
jgi:hypothetical protein